MTRQEANREILKYLGEMVETLPGWRFGQILFNINLATHRINGPTVVDIFFEESEDMYNRVKPVEKVLDTTDEQ